MNVRNIEFKARVCNIDAMEKKLLELAPVYKGLDRQTDTYFNVKRGRLKLREGNIENALIHYERADKAGKKQSNVILYSHKPDKALKEILVHHLGVKVVVQKERKIYYVDNVKFHFDSVVDLGNFIEVEAINLDNRYSIDHLNQQCDYYFDFFGLEDTAMVELSYSDMLLKAKGSSSTAGHQA